MTADLSPEQLAEMTAALARTEPASGEDVRRALSDAQSVGGHNHQPLISERLRRVEARVPAIVRRLLDAEADVDRLRAQIDDMVHAAMGARKVRLFGEVGEVQNARTIADAQLTRANTLDRLCREKNERIAELETSPLAWAEQLDLKSLDNLLISLGQATEYEPMAGAIDEIHQVLRGFRAAAAEAGESA